MLTYAKIMNFVVVLNRIWIWGRLLVFLVGTCNVLLSAYVFYWG